MAKDQGAMRMFDTYKHAAEVAEGAGRYQEAAAQYRLAAKCLYESAKDIRGSARESLIRRGDLLVQIADAMEKKAKEQASAKLRAEAAAREKNGQGKAGQQKAADGADEPPENIEDLKKELYSYIGLEVVKQEVESLINYVTVMQHRRQAGLPLPDLSLHMVFSGNPGTGKTMIARLMARIYKSLGILSKGHLVETDRAGLVAGYIGQTAIKTKEVIDSAKGGVLFIDEAYTLTNRGGERDFGQEAVDTLLKALEDMRDDLIVIVAGYTELMEQFVNSNPGLKSRFNRFLEFPDYTVDELMGIFDMRCKKGGYRLKDDQARAALRWKLTEASKDLSTFGNARGVRNLFEQALTKQADRIAGAGEFSKEDLVTLTAEDILRTD